MKQVVIIVLILGIITSVITLAIAAYFFQKLQQKSKERNISPTIKDIDDEPVSQATMIYSKEKLETMEQKEKREHKDRPNGSSKSIQSSKKRSSSKNSSISFVPKPAQLDAPEEISQTQVLPKNQSALGNLIPPQEISGLGFNTSKLSPNSSHRNDFLSDDDDSEDDIDPEDSTNIIPR